MTKNILSCLREFTVYIYAKIYSVHTTQSAHSCSRHCYEPWGGEMFSFLAEFFSVWRLLQNQTRITSRSKFNLSASSVISAPTDTCRQTSRQMERHLHTHTHRHSYTDSSAVSTHRQTSRQLDTTRAHTHTHTHIGFCTVASTHTNTHTFSEDPKKALARKTSSQVWSRERKCPPSEVSQTQISVQVHKNTKRITFKFSFYHPWMRAW